MTKTRVHNYSDRPPAAYEHQRSAHKGIGGRARQRAPDSFTPLRFASAMNIITNRQDFNLV